MTRMTREQFEKWVDLVERTEGRTSTDRWTKDGKEYISFAYWATLNNRIERIHVVNNDYEKVIQAALFKRHDVFGTTRMADDKINDHYNDYYLKLIGYR